MHMAPFSLCLGANTANFETCCAGWPVYLSGIVLCVTAAVFQPRTSVKSCAFHSMINTVAPCQDVPEESDSDLLAIVVEEIRHLDFWKLGPDWARSGRLSRLLNNLKFKFSEDLQKHSIGYMMGGCITLGPAYINRLLLWYKQLILPCDQQLHPIGYSCSLI